VAFALATFVESNEDIMLSAWWQNATK